MNSPAVFTTRFSCSVERARLTPISLAVFAMSAIGLSCSPDGVVNTGPTVLLCHVAGSVGTVEKIPLTDVAERITQGDYVVRMEVDRGSTAGDGIHFTRITDALAAARAGRIARNELDKAACRVTIAVAAGRLSGSTAPSTDPSFEHFPLVIDVPDITLQGALVMQMDGSSRATGEAVGGIETTFAPSPALVLKGASSQTSVSERTIIVNGHPDGPKGNGAIIQGFAFQSGRAAGDTTVGGQGIGSFRVRDLIIRGNRFEGGFNSSIDLQASSALVELNHLSGKGSSCDVCLAGPGDFVVRQNRILDGGIPGVLILPTGSFPTPPEVEPSVLPSSALVTAFVDNNEVIGHLRKPVGVGLRVGALGVGAASVVSTSKVTFTQNNLVNNTFGIIIEAAFLNASGRRGDIEVTTRDNTFSRSCQNDVLVTLSGSQTGLGIQNGLYLINSSYKLNFGNDISWGDVWFANASGFGNTLMVNGEVLPSGAFAPYDATRTCS